LRGKEFRYRARAAEPKLARQSIDAAIVRAKSAIRQHCAGRVGALTRRPLSIANSPA
jgi:hypothetical protein